MDIESFRARCLSYSGTSEETPFGPDTLVFKVMGKMFALCDIQNFESVNLKCDPEKAIELRERYSGIRPGYHMNKQHWNTIESGSIDNKLLLELIDHSYNLVRSGLTKKLQQQLNELE